MAKEKESKKEDPKMEVEGPHIFKAKEYTKEELAAVFDQLLFEGEYKEDVTIKGKLRVAFRTRNAAETMNISRVLDSSDFKLLPTIQEQRAFLNITKSLVAYQGKDLSEVKDEEKIAFIRKLPTSLISAMADSLAEFDRKIDLACRDAENSF